MFQQLSVLQGPDSEPVELGTLRRHLRLDTTDDDELLQLYAATARSLAENYLSRALATQKLRWSVSDSPPGPRWPLAATPVILPLWLPFPLNYQSPLRLPRSPVQSIERVAVSRTGQLSDTELRPGDYSSDITADPARLLLQPSAQPALGQHVMIDFTAGYDDEHQPLPKVLRHAILFGTTWLYEHRGDDDAPMADAFYALLTPYRQVTFG